MSPSNTRIAAEHRRKVIDTIGWWMFGLTFGVCLAGAAVWMAAGAWIGAGFFAKQLCSGVFVSGRDAEQIVGSDLRLYMPAIVYRHMGWEVDERSGTVRARWMKSIGREARFKGAQGCELVYDFERSERRAGISTQGATSLRTDTHGSPSVDGSHSIPFGRNARRVDVGAVDAIVAEEFDTANERDTRAVIVVHRGMVVAERYASGYGAQTRFPGWSMSKSVMNAMVGALVLQNRLQVGDPVAVAAWRAPGDPRAGVTYDQLLRMSSGLRFDENYASPFSDVTRMLFGVADASAYAESRPLAALPGTVWSYSSGSTMVLAHALAAYAGTRAAYEEMPRRLIFGPIGMRSAVMETDARGNFEATSSVYATALDWARFGWLYANDGVWNGVRVLPAGWIRYSTTPTAADSTRRYGAHFWLYTAEDRARVHRTHAASLPEDSFYAEGFGGQRITISPSNKTVIVRLGAAREEDGFDNTLFAARILRALRVDDATYRASSDAVPQGKS